MYGLVDRKFSPRHDRGEKLTKTGGITATSDVEGELRRTRFGEELRESSRFQLYDIPEGDRVSDRHQFVGNYLPVQDWVRQLGHPEPDALRGLRVFVGVEEGVYNTLKHGDTPSRIVSDSSDPAKEERDKELPVVPVVGALSDSEAAGAARGAYSLLSDGSFLLVELD